MTDIVSIRRERSPVVVGDREVKKLAVRYDLRMAQIRGLIAIHGDNASKLGAAARRLKRL